MSLRDSQFGELKVPLTWTAALALIVAAVVAAALLLADRRETLQAEAYGAVRSATDSVLAPVGDALSAPGRWTGAGIDAIRGYFFAVSENRRLKAQLKEMRQWRDVAFALRNENGRFRSLLGLKTDPPIPMVAARVVIDSRGPFADTRIANSGRETGVRVGNPVMSEYGLVGRVIGVTNGASRVLMLTDVASRTPVMIDRNNARAILSGDGGPNPRLDYLRGQDPVREGDRVLTSGDGGVLPRGLPVGFAVKGLDGKWRVVLASDKGPIDFVRILLFQDYSQLVDRKELDRLPPPPPTPGAETLPLAPPAAAPALLSAGQPGAAAAAKTPGGPTATPATGAKPATTTAPLAKSSATPAAKPAEATATPKPGLSTTAKPAAKPAAGPKSSAPPAAKSAAKSAAGATAPRSSTGAAATAKPGPAAAAKPATKPATKPSVAPKPSVAAPPAPKPKAEPVDAEPPL